VLPARMMSLALPERRLLSCRLCQLCAIAKVTSSQTYGGLVSQGDLAGLQDQSELAGDGVGILLVLLHGGHCD
jgi:hypothetical protein